MAKSKKTSRNSKPSIPQRVKGAIRQSVQQRAIRIAETRLSIASGPPLLISNDPVPAPPAAPPAPPAPRVDLRLIAELATCLWYLKAKYFKREWTLQDNGDDEPRVRRALGRLNKAIDALKAGGFELVDPTNKRYPPGGDATLIPIQYQQTAGLDHPRVAETVVPIVCWNDNIIQRAEVFVASPVAEGGAVPDPNNVSDSSAVTPTVALRTPSQSDPTGAPGSVADSESQNPAAGEAGHRPVEPA